MKEQMPSPLLQPYTPGKGNEGGEWREKQGPERGNYCAAPISTAYREQMTHYAVQRLQSLINERSLHLMYLVHFRLPSTSNPR